MQDSIWDGPDPKDRIRCPYSVDFDFKPAPAESLSSLESGRLLMTVLLDGDDIEAVAVRLINNAKKHI